MDELFNIKNDRHLTYITFRFDHLETLGKQNFDSTALTSGCVCVLFGLRLFGDNVRCGMLFLMLFEFNQFSTNVLCPRGSFPLTLCFRFVLWTSGWGADNRTVFAGSAAIKWLGAEILCLRRPRNTKPPLFNHFLRLFVSHVCFFFTSCNTQFYNWENDGQIFCNLFFISKYF